ncbi:MAG: hypothetical protein TYPL_1820 [Candidatus Tyloplasma litorale]|nr:MAG: hypothetical protein TYPL_1820 [Mycoplasmatales bacterium]
MKKEKISKRKNLRWWLNIISFIIVIILIFINIKIIKKELNINSEWSLLSLTISLIIGILAFTINFHWREVNSNEERLEWMLQGSEFESIKNKREYVIKRIKELNEKIEINKNNFLWNSDNKQKLTEMKNNFELELELLNEILDYLSSGNPRISTNLIKEKESIYFFKRIFYLFKKIKIFFIKRKKYLFCFIMNRKNKWYEIRFNNKDYILKSILKKENIKNNKYISIIFANPKKKKIIFKVSFQNSLNSNKEYKLLKNKILLNKNDLNIVSFAWKDKKFSKFTKNKRNEIVNNLNEFMKLFFEDSKNNLKIKEEELSRILGKKRKNNKYIKEELIDFNKKILNIKKIQDDNKLIINLLKKENLNFMYFRYYFISFLNEKERENNLKILINFENLNISSQINILDSKYENKLKIFEFICKKKNEILTWGNESYIRVFKKKINKYPNYSDIKYKNIKEEYLNFKSKNINTNIFEDFTWLFKSIDIYYTTKKEDEYEYVIYSYMGIKKEIVKI